MQEQISEDAREPQWTPLQRAYAGKLFSTYEANLYFLQKNFNRVYLKLINAELTSPFLLSTDAKLEILIGKYRGSEQDFVDYYREIYVKFDNSDTRTGINVSVPHLDNDQGVVAPHRDSEDFYKTVEPQFRTELISKFQEICPTEVRNKRPDFGRRCLPLAFVFGVGYGWQLEKLVDEYEIRHLIVADTDIERFVLSLYFVDYVSLFHRFLEKGVSITIGFEENAERLGYDILEVIRANCPPYFVQGAGLLFHAMDSQELEKVWLTVKDGLRTLFRGWGFLDDEMIGLKQAIQNVGHRIPLYTGKEKVPNDAVAFVVGAGPSLDGLLPLLEKYKDKAVIIGCGTGSSALQRLGILPDFHVEIERLDDTYRKLASPAYKDWIGGVPIIASAIMAPRVFSLGKESYIFLKAIDFGSNVIDIDGVLPRIHTNPTCTNGGLNFVLDMGFKKVYLFGIDVGFRSSDYHHSKQSFYYSDIEVTDLISCYRACADSENKEYVSVPANFGGDDVYSTNSLIYCRDVHNWSIGRHLDAKVYNLNDGALIDNAIPLRPQDVDLQTRFGSKQEAMVAIKRGFDANYQIDIRLNLVHIAEQLQAVAADLRKLWSEYPLKDKMSAIDALAAMHHYIYAEPHQKAAVFPLLRGSMSHMGRFAYDAISYIPDEKKALEFARYAFDLFERFILAARNNVLSLGKYVDTPDAD